MKSNNSIIETIPWITLFIDIKSMNIHQAMGSLIEKTMKSYFKVMTLSL